MRQSPRCTGRVPRAGPVRCRGRPGGLNRVGLRRIGRWRHRTAALQLIGFSVEEGIKLGEWPATSRPRTTVPAQVLTSRARRHEPRSRLQSLRGIPPGASSRCRTLSPLIIETFILRETHVAFKYFDRIDFGCGAGVLPARPGNAGGTPAPQEEPGSFSLARSLGEEPCRFRACAWRCSGPGGRAGLDLDRLASGPRQARPSPPPRRGTGAAHRARAIARAVHSAARAYQLRASSLRPRSQ